MLDYVIAMLQNAASQPVALLFALVLGALSAATSACCTLPALGILVGYSGARAEVDRSSAIRSVIFFTVGTVLSLMVIGGIAGFVGQAAQTSLGAYWKLFAGVVAIAFGLVTLELLPFNLPAANLGGAAGGPKRVGPAAAGLLMGGGLVACSLPCNPGIFIVLGAAVLQGQVIWAVLLLAMFALGYSLPLSALLLGVSLGKTAFLSKKADAVVRWVSGSLLLAAGFYLLFTF